MRFRTWVQSEKVECEERGHRSLVVVPGQTSSSCGAVVVLVSMAHLGGGERKRREHVLMSKFVKTTSRTRSTDLVGLFA